VKRVLILIPVAGALLASACGGGGDGKSSTAAQASPDTWPRYAKCLREHGVDMPDDPKKMPANGVTITDKAQAACKGLAPQGKAIDMKDPATREKFTRVARCMRKHGIDMPDPNADGSNMPAPNWDGGNKAKFDAAMKVCGKEL
jgi:hypothetical protein